MMARRGVVEIEPDNIVTLNNLAWALNELGDPKAIEYAERASNLAPYAPSVMDTQGWILVRQERSCGEGSRSGPRLRRQLAEVFCVDGSVGRGPATRT